MATEAAVQQEWFNFALKLPSSLLNVFYILISDYTSTFRKTPSAAIDPWADVCQSLCCWVWICCCRESTQSTVTAVYQTQQPWNTLQQKMFYSPLKANVVMKCFMMNTHRVRKLFCINSALFVTLSLLLFSWLLCVLWENSSKLFPFLSCKSVELFLVCIVSQGHFRGEAHYRHSQG